MFTVSVRASWESISTFEFETQEEADDFQHVVEGGGGAGLDAIVENETSELESHNADLIGWEVC